MVAARIIDGPRIIASPFLGVIRFFNDIQRLRVYFPWRFTNSDLFTFQRMLYCGVDCRVSVQKSVIKI